MTIEEMMFQELCEIIEAFNDLNGFTEANKLELLWIAQPAMHPDGNSKKTCSVYQNAGVK